MNTIECVQGSDEWKKIRLDFFTASEAPAMLGLSKYTTRAELLRQKATGVAEEVDAGKQRLFDAGHEAEAKARPIAERLIGEDLFPVTGSREVEGLPLLASFDGLTMGEDVAWENKLWNDGFAQQVMDDEVPDTHWPQLEQQLLVSGADKVLFTVSDGSEDRTVSTWYESRPARRTQLIAGWKQFAADLAAYQPVEVIPAAVAAPINDLPALAIEITGNVVASNLAQWRGIVTERIASINTDLQTDQQFADADKMVKFLADGEQRIEVVKAQAQSQATSIDEVFRALDEIKATMRTKRLELDKLVKARKENIRGEIAQGGQKSYAEHCTALNARLKGQYLPGSIIANFAEVMKGKKNISSLRDAVSTELARVKIESNALADRISINLGCYGDLAPGFEFLFRDLFNLVIQPAEAFYAIVDQRIKAHVEAKRKEEEATRERIAKEEREKAEREAAAKLEEERRQAAAAERAKIAQEQAEAKAKAEAATLRETAVCTNSQTDQATVSQNGASSTPGLSTFLPAEAAAHEPAPAAAPTATGAASVAQISPVAGEIERAGLVSELRESLLGLSLAELQQVAHFIDRIQSTRQRAA